MLLAQTSRMPVGLSAASAGVASGGGAMRTGAWGGVASCRVQRGLSGRVTDLLLTSVAWTTSRVRSRPSRPGARPPGRAVPSGAGARPGALRGRLGRVQRADGGDYPFHHPRYAGQMLKPPHPVAIAAYTAAMHVNANNHALDGGPATSAMEVEVMRDLADDVRLPGGRARPPDLDPARSPTSRRCGWRASCTRTRRSSSAPTRTTPTRGCARVLGDRGRSRTDDLEAVEAPQRRASGRSWSPRARPARAPSTTSRGRSRCASATACACTSTPPTAGSSRCSTSSSRWRPFRAIADADSVVVDPHKHGLQPYGCGAVLFRDPGVGRLYKHDSPYTYFTSGDLHLGEISSSAHAPARPRRRCG